MIGHDMSRIVPEFKTVGLDIRQAKNMTIRFLLHYHRKGKRGRRYHLPPHLCFTCLTIGQGREHAFRTFVWYTYGATPRRTILGRMSAPSCNM